MKIKAIRPIPVGERIFQPGEIVKGLTGKDLEKAKADDQVVEVQEKKVKRGDRKNT